MTAPDGLRLEAPGACLEQARPRLMTFRTLVGLGYGEADAVLMPSLERLAGWVLNLEDPQVPGGTLFQSGLEAALGRLAGAGPDPVERLAAGLGGLLQVVAEGLARCAVHAGGESRAPDWGAHAGSLWGWAQAHGVQRVRCERRAAAAPNPAAVALLAGRVLSGATLACLEAREPAALRSLWTPAAGGAPLAASVAAAAAALVRRGLWRPDQPPGRVWREGEHPYLLWPLAGEDLRAEAALFGAVPAESGAWLEALRAAGCVREESGAALALRPHPLLRRPVQALCAAGPLADALRPLLWP